MANALISLINATFGSSSTKGDECMVNCPYCHHRKKKMSINLITHKWKCWVCNKRGLKLTTLFYKVGASESTMNKIRTLTKTGTDYSKRVKDLKERVSLPVEFIPMYAGNYRSPDFRNAISYLKKRGVGKHEMLRYNIGYCESGEYNGMVVIPSYDANGQLNYYVGRSFYESEYKHKLPKISKDIIGNELLINWKEPINIVEGFFDAIAVGDNTIPLFGKQIPNKLKLKICDSGVKRINILLDGDAITDALQHAEYFINNGIEVHLIEMGDLDPSELGHEAVQQLIEDSVELDFHRIMELKLGIY